MLALTHKNKYPRAYQTINKRGNIIDNFWPWLLSFSILILLLTLLLLNRFLWVILLNFEGIQLRINYFYLFLDLITIFHFSLASIDFIVLSVAYSRLSKIISAAKLVPRLISKNGYFQRQYAIEAYRSSWTIFLNWFELIMPII